MAFILNPDAQLVFFNQVFGVAHSVTQKAKALIGAGVTFETSMYAVKASVKGKAGSQTQVGLTTGTTSLMKHTVEFAVEQQNKTLIADWVAELFAMVDPVNVPATPSVVSVYWDPYQPKPNIISLIKAVRIVTGLGLAQAKMLAEAINGGQSVVLTLSQPVSEAQVTLAQQGVKFGSGAVTFADLSKQAGAAAASFDKTSQAFAAVKPVDKVIDLKDAKALGQKVHGTSQSSVYYCIAVAEHVKVAARIAKGGGISIRAEWDAPVPADLKKLEDSNMQMKGNYGSMHFDAGEVPLQRVIGAFLVGTGINWKAAVMNGADLVIGG